jgi:hypothetical protein
LKSLRRIIVSFYSIEAAISIRTTLDGTTLPSLSSDRIRVYFGQPTPINPEDQHLQAPKSQKLFFISPPPSPPAGWEIRNEEAPNKEVHAEDLLSALSKLGADSQSPAAEFDESRGTDFIGSGQASTTRQRSGSSTIVYDPHDHGDSPDLPAIAVEDTTESPGALSPMEGVEGGSEKIFAHTARPPVELMS